MSFLTNKIGPLPAWGWGAVAGGGLLLLKAKGGKPPAGQDPNAPGATPGAPGASTAVMYGGSGNNYADPTFGGGSLGMYSWPYAGGGNMFVNLWKHPFGDSWRFGGHHYPFHAFDRHPFFNWGGLFGGGDHDRDDRFRGFGGFDRGRSWGHGDGDRGVGWNNDPYQYPRGATGGHFGPGGDNGRASRWVDNNASSPGNHVR